MTRSLLIGLFVTLRNVRRDVGVDPPLFCLLQHLKKRRRNGNGNLFARLELFNLNPAMDEIHILPLQQHAILEPLSRVHADVEDDLDFLLVDQMKPGIIQYCAKLFLLFRRERNTPDCSILLLTLFAHQHFQ